VFPEARFRFFVTASLEERARRRFQELGRQGEKVLEEEIQARMALRDQQDRTRELAPLTVPEGAVVIDTTALTPDEVVDRMMESIDSRGR